MADRLEQMRAKLAAHKRARSEAGRAASPDEKPRTTLAQKQLKFQQHLQQTRKATEPPSLASRVEKGRSRDF